MPPLVGVLTVALDAQVATARQICKVVHLLAQFVLLTIGIVEMVCAEYHPPIVLHLLFVLLVMLSVLRVSIVEGMQAIVQLSLYLVQRVHLPVQLVFVQRQVEIVPLLQHVVQTKFFV